MKGKTSFCVAILLTAACSAIAAGIAGTWTGDSICTIRDSPCHDEKVIYHISEPDKSGNLKIQADKVVNGQPEDMGTLDCSFNKETADLKCSMKNGNWEFKMSGNKLTGTLKLPDGRLYRTISVSKES